MRERGLNVGTDSSLGSISCGNLLQGKAPKVVQVDLQPGFWGGAATGDAPPNPVQVAFLCSVKPVCSNFSAKYHREENVRRL